MFQLILDALGGRFCVRQFDAHFGHDLPCALGVLDNDLFQRPGPGVDFVGELIKSGVGLASLFGERLIELLTGRRQLLWHSCCHAPLRTGQQGELDGKRILVSLAPFGQDLSQPFRFLGRSPFTERIEIGLIHD
jgi:hypothetical protein